MMKFVRLKLLCFLQLSNKSVMFYVFSNSELSEKMFFFSIPSWIGNEDSSVHFAKCS